MKKILCLIFTLISGLSVFAQEADTTAHEGFAFPIKSKVTIKLIPVDSVNFHYKVLKVEPFNETPDVSDKACLPASLEENTLEFVFCVGTMGDRQKGNGKNLKTLLFIKHGLKFALEYNADIQCPNVPEFKNTSVMALFPNVPSTEIWPYPIEQIALYGFKKTKF
ncbi:hypothetical protein [Parabacteroides sp. FAFU027]|uniref:hypothetical protein n=1 Tax=Parabacteroides sp. FAFU027 TaxID=2922715 RepID=UPI001FAF99E6|nr:hypothetical protein [Parabacteroides sp. FAFU027]